MPAHGASLSVVIPVRNGMPYIREALDSVLRSSIPGLEIIVRENFSTDGTAEWLATLDDPRLTVLVADEPSSAGANWSAACAAATGDWVKLLCADDFITPGGLERQWAAAQSHPGAVMVASRRQIVSDTGRIVIGRLGLSGFVGTVPGASARTRATLSGANPFGEPSSVLLRRDALDSSLPFTSEFPYLTDLDMYVKVLEHGDLVGLPTVDGAFRVSGTSWSSAIGNRQLEEFEAWLADMESKKVISPGRFERLLLAMRVRRRFLARRAVSTALTIESRIRGAASPKGPREA